MKTVKERVPVLVDQGDADNFFGEQLIPQLLIVEAAQQAQYPKTKHHSWL